MCFAFRKSARTHEVHMCTQGMGGGGLALKVRMRGHTHIHIHTSKHTDTHAHTHAQTRTHTQTHTRTRTHTHTHTSTPHLKQSCSSDGYALHALAGDVWRSCRPDAEASGNPEKEWRPSPVCVFRFLCVCVC